MRPAARGWFTGWPFRCRLALLASILNTGVMSGTPRARKPPDKTARSWAEMHKLNPLLFPSLLELSNDRGPIGQVLARIPEKILRKAARRSDPWGFLDSVRGVSALERKVFQAAASVVNARLRLVHMGKGTASLNTDWERELRQAQVDGSQPMLEHAESKCFTALHRYKNFRADPGNVERSVRDEFERRAALVRKELIKRGRGAESEGGASLPGDAEFRQFRLHRALAWWRHAMQICAQP